MGLVRKARAVKGIAKARVADAAEAAEERLDSRAYRAAKRGTVKSAGAVRSGARQGRDAALQRAAGGERTSRVGAVVRRATQEMAALPGLSWATDANRAKNGVRDAAKLIRESPDDPLPVVWLAECLRRVEADQRAYHLARAAVAPTSVLVRAGMRTGAALGTTEIAAQPSQRASRKAAMLGLKRVRAHPGDETALHALARAAILDRRTAEAVGLARAAVDASGADPCALVTLARAHLAAGDRTAARRAAALAVRRGSTVGYEVLADLALRERAGTDSYKQQISAYESLLARVERPDYVAYYGVKRSAGSFARAFLAAQGGKSWRLTRRVGHGAARAAAAGGRPGASTDREEH